MPHRAEGADHRKREVIGAGSYRSGSGSVDTPPVRFPARARQSATQPDARQLLPLRGIRESAQRILARVSVFDVALVAQPRRRTVDAGTWRGLHE